MRSLIARVMLVAVCVAYSCAIASAKDTRPPYSVHVVMRVQPNGQLVQPGRIGIAQTVRITEQQCTGTVLEQNRPPGLGCNPETPALSVEAHVVTAGCRIQVTMTQPGMFSITRLGPGGNVTLSAPQQAPIRGLCEVEFRDPADHAFATLLI
jgi:hypothetical protein